MIMNVDFMYPIGSIYISVNSTNPSKWFGGTWVTWGTGRVPVGVDTSQSEFSGVEKTGGSKQMQKHSHNWSTSYCYQYNQIVGGGGAGLCNWSSSGQYVNPINVKIGESGSGNSGNLQPYITCYMWKRTA